MRFWLLFIFSMLLILPRVLPDAAVRDTVPAEITERLVSAAQNPNVEDTEVGKISKILSIVTAGTKFAGRVNLNGRLQENALNVYLLAPNLRLRQDIDTVFFAARVFGNCAFVGIKNTIVCDSDFLSSFLAKHGIVSEGSSGSPNQRGWTHQDAFLGWILGHELGHVVQGGAAAHFGQANVLDEPTDAATELMQKKETDADLFAAKQIESDRLLMGTLESLLIELINREIEDKNGKSAAYGVGLYWDYADKAVIEYFANRDHPEFVVRATRMLTTLSFDTHEEGLHALIESFSRHLVPVGKRAPLTPPVTK